MEAGTSLATGVAPVSVSVSVGVAGSVPGSAAAVFTFETSPLSSAFCVSQGGKWQGSSWLMPCHAGAFTSHMVFGEARKQRIPTTGRQYLHICSLIRDDVWRWDGLLLGCVARIPCQRADVQPQKSRKWRKGRALCLLLSLLSGVYVSTYALPRWDSRVRCEQRVCRSCRCSYRTLLYQNITDFVEKAHNTAIGPSACAGSTSRTRLTGFPRVYVCMCKSTGVSSCNAKRAFQTAAAVVCVFRETVRNHSEFRSTRPLRVKRERVSARSKRREVNAHSGTIGATSMCAPASLPRK